VRLPSILAFLLAALTASLLVGCSRKAETLVGAGRLIRGPGGLGTTVRIAPNPDRDTFVDPGTANFDSLLLVGTSGVFQARTFLSVATWALPDTNLPDFTPQSMSLALQADLNLGIDPSQITLSLTSATWDTTNVAWPGPAAGAQIGTAIDDRASGTFLLPLTTTFPEVVSWAQNPSSVPGFTLQSTGPLVSYVAGKARFRIRYTHTVSGTTVLDSIDTPVTQDFYLRSPLSPAPTGADTSLALGGLYRSELALHFPVDSIPSGVSVDEATLVLFLVPGSSAPDTADASGLVRIRAIRSTWSETVTDRAAFLVDANVAAAGNLVALYSSTGRMIRIRLPSSLMREWAATPSTNFGLLVQLLNGANLTKRFDIGSRESSKPAELHVTYTALPPGRF
jgi:hypothetical protein